MELFASFFPYERRKRFRILHTHTYIFSKLCSNIIEYLILNAFERTQNTSFSIISFCGWILLSILRLISEERSGIRSFSRGKNSKSEISSSFRTTRTTNEREPLYHHLATRKTTAFRGGAFCGWIILSLFAWYQERSVKNSKLIN